MKFADLYLPMSTDEREQFARRVESDPGYLWQLATQWNGKKPSLKFMEKLAAADARLTVGELAEEFAGGHKTVEKAGA